MRLLRRGDFESVYRGGHRHFARDLTAFWRGRVAGEGPRVGLTVGRALGGAVVRNRIKRRLREAVRLNLAQLARAVDVVINPRKSAASVEFQELVQQVAGAFRAISQDVERRAAGERPAREKAVKKS